MRCNYCPFFSSDNKIRKRLHINYYFFTSFAPAWIHIIYMNILVYNTLGDDVVEPSCLGFLKIVSEFSSLRFFLPPLAISLPLPLVCVHETNWVHKESFGDKTKEIFRWKYSKLLALSYKVHVPCKISIMEGHRWTYTSNGIDTKCKSATKYRNIYPWTWTIYMHLKKVQINQ